MAKQYKALGLMSGTSIDGIDAAIIHTDGTNVIRTGLALTRKYSPNLRNRIRQILGGKGEIASVSRDMTLEHVEVVKSILVQSNMQPRDIDIIGFHGHTILHNPQEGRTCQIGDGSLLAKSTRIKVIGDFRRADVSAGGEGAPLVPLYHSALARMFDKPLAILNIGGVANVTWIGSDNRILAFDTGPGNALIDDWLFSSNLGEYDFNGELAAQGRVEQTMLDALLENPFFLKAPPKSLDRNTFSDASELVNGLTAADGAATLTAYTAATVAKCEAIFPKQVRRWLVCGGGRKNKVMMQMLREQLTAEVASVEAVGWNGDALEAEAFAYLAVRSLLGMPITLPETTGAPRPISGGILFQTGRKKT